jgi:hypothetical protein
MKGPPLEFGGNKVTLDPANKYILPRITKHPGRLTLYKTFFWFILASPH